VSTPPPVVTKKVSSVEVKAPLNPLATANVNGRRKTVKVGKNF
jgi:hypothetical protein